MHLRLGELVKVDLYVSLPAARNFVVVDDPVVPEIVVALAHAGRRLNCCPQDPG